MDGSDASNELKSNIASDRDLQRRNEKFDKWWYTADNDYLEIIYEEDENDDKVRLYENPVYDEEEKRKRMNNTSRPNGTPLGKDVSKFKLFKIKQKTAIEGEHDAYEDDSTEINNKLESKQQGDSILDKTNAKDLTRDTNQMDKS